VMRGISYLLTKLGTVTIEAMRKLPTTPRQWLDEIRLAIADANDTKPFGRLIGQPITNADLFHLAPLVALKFRGRRARGAEADRVTKTALANYVVNSDPDGIDHGLEAKPTLAFALCYVATHLALDMLDEQEAEVILNQCEEQLDEG
jgi:hypothetical protein